MSQESLNNWLKLQPPTVAKRLMIRTPEESGRLYHISTDGGIKRFTPYVTDRTGNGENRSIPRISVAPSLAGCFIGYAKAWSDIAWPALKDKKFKNGWYIYDIPYQYALSPAKKELFDVEDTDEHWLVSYSPETVSYLGNVVGKAFVSELKMVPRTGKFPAQYQRTLFEVISGDIKLFPDKVLTEGYWEVFGPCFESNGSLTEVNEYEIKKITFAEYAKSKKYNADMLSLSQPPSFKW